MEHVMGNKKIALALLIASLSCNARVSDKKLKLYADEAHEAINNKSKNLRETFLEYIKNNAIENPELVRKKCLELAKILKIELEYFMKDKMNNSAVQRQKFFDLQNTILDHVYNYNENFATASLINYADYISRDYLDCYNAGIDDEDPNESEVLLMQKTAKSFISKINQFEKSLYD